MFYKLVVQVAAQTLGISDSKIHISDTSTDKVPNTPPTAASVGSDLNGMAVLEACKTINKRFIFTSEQFSLTLVKVGEVQGPESIWKMGRLGESSIL